MPDGKPRARGIINHCQEPGHFLRKELGQRVAFYLEPGGARVRTVNALAAIRSGWLVPRDLDLFGNPDNAQAWIYARKIGSHGC